MHTPSDQSCKTQAIFTREAKKLNYENHLNFAGEKTPIQSLALAPWGLVKDTVTESAVSPCHGHQKQYYQKSPNDDSNAFSTQKVHQEEI
jgi:hypothetical protein